ncbi:uncharacterized protein LOC143191124 [Rhynchophorus ferrugineus]|uniref:uncharacterized protein LOC143191124 n=1 Tax=Rhynchophorus ferrugineus TaxID=354439 RepID=UPI003FCCC199
MDAMLQRHCARYIYVIPDGLKELMSDISREVLRSQPQDIYTFIADYLDALMITRENARVAARLVQSLTEMATTTATFLEETGMSRDEIDNVVLSIHKTFKKSIDLESERPKFSVSDEVDEVNIVHEIVCDANINPDQAEVAAKIIQGAYRRFKERQEQEKKLLTGLIDWRVAARSAIRLYRQSGVTNIEANRAATLIKAAYKGYYTRRMMKSMVRKRLESLEEKEQEECEHENYDEEIEEYPEEFDDLCSLDKPKSVTINYDTVIPHVDFDTGKKRSEIPSQVPLQKLSTASSIAKHSIGLILDAALTMLDMKGAASNNFGSVTRDLDERQLHAHSSLASERVLDSVQEEQTDVDT